MWFFFWGGGRATFLSATVYIAFFGHTFSEEDKANLQKKGNMGRAVELVNKNTGEIIPSIISIDKQTNELVALRAEKIRIPDEIKGVKLNEQQKHDLQQGKAVYVEDWMKRYCDRCTMSKQNQTIHY